VEKRRKEGEGGGVKGGSPSDERGGLQVSSRVVGVVKKTLEKRHSVARMEQSNNDYSGDDEMGGSKEAVGGTHSALGSPKGSGGGQWKEREMGRMGARYQSMEETDVDQLVEGIPHR